MAYEDKDRDIDLPFVRGELKKAIEIECRHYGVALKYEFEDDGTKQEIVEQLDHIADECADIVDERLDELAEKI